MEPPTLIRHNSYFSWNGFKRFNCLRPVVRQRRGRLSNSASSCFFRLQLPVAVFVTMMYSGPKMCSAGLIRARFENGSKGRCFQAFG